MINSYGEIMSFQEIKEEVKEIQWLIITSRVNKNICIKRGVIKDMIEF